MKTILRFALAALLSLPGSAIAQPSPGTTYYSTSVAVTLTTAGVFQTVLTYANTRRGCFIQNNNTSDAVYVFFQNPFTLPAATQATSVKLTAGQSMNCNSGPFVAGDTIQMTGANNNDTALLIYQTGSQQ